MNLIFKFINFFNKFLMNLIIDFFVFILNIFISVIKIIKLIILIFVFILINKI